MLTTFTAMGLVINSMDISMRKNTLCYIYLSYILDENSFSTHQFVYNTTYFFKCNILPKSAKMIFAYLFGR